MRATGTDQLAALLRDIERDPPRSDDGVERASDALTPYRDRRTVAHLLALLGAYSPAEPSTCILQRDDIRVAARDALREVTGQ